MIQLAFKTHLTKICDRKCFQKLVAALLSGFTRKTVGKQHEMWHVPWQWGFSVGCVEWQGNLLVIPSEVDGHPVGCTQPSEERNYLMTPYTTNTFAVWSIASACKMSTTQNQLHQISNTQRTENKTTDVVIQQHSRKLLMMDILMPETCWAHKKWNKITSDIKLVFHSSTTYHLFGYEQTDR